MWTRLFGSAIESIIKGMLETEWFDEVVLDTHLRLMYIIYIVRIGITRLARHYPCGDPIKSTFSLFLQTQNSPKSMCLRS